MNLIQKWHKNNTHRALSGVESSIILIAIVFAAGDRPEQLDKIRIELILRDGSTLTFERMIPLITNELVDLG
ncbi:MAG: Archaeal flagellin [Thaumarchaeota archaeon CSP1-1]|nr:MAG: Archaeal flagellin [Thaumarchaeota archaeon CSP1-1]